MTERRAAETVTERGAEAPEPVTLAWIGAGPAGVMLLERVIARHARDAPGVPVRVHLIDPHRPGGGRIWRREQSPLLKLNSTLEDVAFFTDATCSIDGPIAPGPSLAEWVRAVRAGRIARAEWIDAELAHEIATIGDRDFPTRRLNHAYLSWAFEETLRRADPALSVVWHRDTAVAVESDSGTGGAPHHVRLESGRTISADLVIYALGHTGTDPSADSLRLADFANRHGLDYVAPAFTADVDFDHLAAGEHVIVRGLGLAAIDLAVMLTGGRGGRFITRADGTLAYEPSGREPILHFGSRRGVPYRSKITSRTVGDPVTLEYLGRDFHAALADRSEPLDFERDAWPLIAAELITGYYRELFTGHPELVSGSWEAFAQPLRAVLGEDRGWNSAALAALVAAHVPDPDHRFDLASFDRPLAHAAGGGGVGGGVGGAGGAGAGCGGVGGADGGAGWGEAGGADPGASPGAAAERVH